MKQQYPTGLPKPSLIALLLLAQLSPGSAAWAQSAQCPNPPPVTISPQLPADVCIPTGAPGVPFAFFDDFSWRSFVALVWPAQSGQRGVPDPKQSIGSGTGPLVFETFKSDWELFQPNGAAPSAWNSFAGANPCNLPNVGFNDLVLASFSKFGNLGQAGFGTLVGPLVAQNQTYTLFHTGFNQTEFNQISSNKWYLQANLVPPIEFQQDASGNPIDFKASWMDMTNVKDPQRYYTRTAWVLDLNTGACSQKTVGLVGLHIVTKTPSRPQWIWSTFEHVDNVPGTGATAPYAYNDGSSTPQPSSNPYGFPPPTNVPAPFNVQRLTPISSSTQATNAAYQKALASQGNGVWQNYQLVMTQWPITPNAPANPGTPAFTFPGTAGATTAFANTTMETFDQTNIRTGCMNCHNQAKSNADFLWSLALNAFPSKLGTPASQPQLHALFRTTAEPQLQELKKLLSLPQAPAPKQKK